MLKEAARLARLEYLPDHRQPPTARVVAAALVAVAASLVADAIVVAIGEVVFPATKGYGHFRFADYARLTVIGVIIAAVSWPIVTRLTWAPRWAYLRLAVIVSIVLWLPDVYLLDRGQPTQAVAVLMVMHVAIALAAYNVIVRMAPVGPTQHRALDT
ncbi:MAG: hypothetical protein ACRDZ8_19435 [Acidimicrobiales bacterium]